MSELVERLKHAPLPQWNAGLRVRGRLEYAHRVNVGVGAKPTFLDERIDLDFEVSSKARIVVPSDLHDFRSVLLNETTGPARVRSWHLRYE